MEIENLLDLYLAGQVELFEEILKGSPEYKKELLQYVEDTYGWAKHYVRNLYRNGTMYYKRSHYHKSNLPKGILKELDWLFWEVLAIYNDTHIHFANGQKSVKLVLPKKAKLPPFVKEVLINNGRIKEIPEYLFGDRVLTLVIVGTLVEKLPPLPKKLKFLAVEYCENLKELPLLPKSLTTLICQGTQVTELPELPAKLECLQCGGNPLKSFPVLPKTLQYIQVYEDQKHLLPHDVPIHVTIV